MRILFALSGFHRYDRGAEVALLSVADELARTGDAVTVVGGGAPRVVTAYDYAQVRAVARERFEKFPSLPGLRDETNWEDATFAARMLVTQDLSGYDATVTCGWPYSNLALRRARRKGARHIFVTQNGDWPAHNDNSEYRFFSCDGLVCTNPAYFARNRDRWPAALIPNGIDATRFSADDAKGRAMRDRLGLPHDRPVVLMVSALIETKRVLDGIRAVAPISDALLVVAGDGPLRAEAAALAERLMPGRFHRVSLPATDMPDLYRAADVFLHMSKVESFGNVFVEAWASGLPVVAHDDGLTRWILGDAQLLCDSDDPAAVTAAVEEGLRQVAGGAVRAVDRAALSRFTWPVIAQQYRAFLRAVVAGGAAPQAAG